MHLLWNMLALWMFGSQLEEIWGEQLFLKFFLFSAFMGGLLTYLVHFWIPVGITVGASGGIYGCLIAFGMIWPNREVLMFFLFPVKAKIFVWIIMAILLFAPGGQTAVFAHAGGLLGGFLFLRYFEFFRNQFEFRFSLSRWLQKRKFQKYQEEMMAESQAKERVDQLLDKISREGIQSLSRKEKKFLNEASQKYFKDQDT
jgi:hypothetical protein